MTTLVLNYSTNLLERLFVFLKGVLVNIMVGFQLARQMESNRKIAHMLKHDYPKWSVEQITAHLNQQTLDHYKEK